MKRFLLLFSFLLSAAFGTLRAQCDLINFNIVHFEPCRFRVTYDNSTDCYTEIRLALAEGNFGPWTAGPGFVVEVVSPSELWITHTSGFLPVGFQGPLLFSLPVDLVTNISIAYLNDCPPGVGCEIFPGPVLESCPDPRNASITGVKYKECGGLPYINQTTLSGWTIELLDEMGNVLQEQTTDSGGSYAFYDLPAGNYVCREAQQAGWTPKVPASGQTAVTLGPSEQRIVNFGNCPPPAPPCNCPAGTQPNPVNLVQNSDFSAAGGFSTAYTLNNSPALQPGQYWIGSNPSQINPGFAACADHTTGSGNMMVVNGIASQNTNIWSQTFSVTPNTTYKFEAWIASLSSASPAQIGTILLIGNNMFGGMSIFAPVTTCTWERLCNEWYNFNATTVTISLINANAATTGNDFAIDDISFRKCTSPFIDVSGNVYTDCNSLPFANQPVLAGWTVQVLDTLGNLVSEQLTDSNGAYAFYDLPPGQYYVKTIAQSGWTPNIPPSGQTTVQLEAGESAVLNFAMCEKCATCPPPSDLALTPINSGEVEVTWDTTKLACGDRVCVTDWREDENGLLHSTTFWFELLPNMPKVIIPLLPGVPHQVFATTQCDSMISGPSDTILFNYPCYGGYTDCPANLVSNGSFENGTAGFPNAADQINQSTGWHAANSGNISSVGDWYNGLWQGFYNDVPNQQYTFLKASCGFGYAGFDLNTCEGISTQLSSAVAPGTGYNIGFWWTPKEPVTAQFDFLAILSAGSCNVNTANGGANCSHQCGGDFHIPVTVTPFHVPGTWYFESHTANAPASFAELTFAAASNGPSLNNYIYIDEVCVHTVSLGCSLTKPRIVHNSQQPNAFFGEAELGAGSTLLSAVWEFGDGSRDSSCCLGSVIHDFAPGTYEVCLTVTAMDSSGVSCSERACIPVVITAAGGKCDHIAAFLQASPLGSCCYELNTNNIEPNCFTQIDVTLSSGNFINTQFGAGWNVALNGNIASLTPAAGGFIPVGQDQPLTLCDPGGIDPYTVYVDFLYPGELCHRSFNISCFPDTSSNCCSDFALFQLQAAQVSTNEQYGDCSISVNGTGLNDCLRISWDWGDGTTEGPYADNTQITHTYTGSGPHTVCYTVEEVDANGQVCWTWNKCLDQPVHCNDTCQCLGFTNLQFTALVVPPPPPVQVDCENAVPVLLPCIPNDTYYEFGGNFGCTNECTSSIGYQFFDANHNLLTYGQATYNSALDQFSISQIKFPPGTYQLVLTGYCGINDTCFCNVNFSIPECPCCSQDLTEFLQTIDNATSISLDAANCKASLNIGTLACQQIEWVDWGDGGFSLGPFLSGAMPMHVYAHSGTYTITYLARELNPLSGVVCYNQLITETIQMNCNCSCGTYDMEIRLGGAQNQPVACGQTINLGLGQGFAFYPKFQCQGNFCPPSTTVDWTLTGPGTNLSGTETIIPGVLFTILPVNPGQFNTPGVYTLTMTGHCDQNQCPCVITFNVQDPCCTDQAAFLVAAANVQTFGTLGTCTLSFQAVGLNNCMRIRYDWGDNSGSGPFPDNTAVTHTYTQTGTYNVCYTIEEVDFSGNVCWTYQSCEPVYVICNDCICGSFSEMFARPVPGGPSIPLVCGAAPFVMGCPGAGLSIPITGKFECAGGNCAATSQVNWTLNGPSGTYSGTITAGPYFYLPILPYYYGTPGNYTLTLTGNCGGQACSPCVIPFTINCPDPCPCSAGGIIPHVKKGFATLLYNNSCKACFSPIGLNDCDMVEWSINNGPVAGMSNGTQTFCYTFPSSGTYSVTMTVLRKKGDGTLCEQFSITRTVTPLCTIISDCSGPLIANPRFSVGAIAGGMGSGGFTESWLSLVGEPVVVEGRPGSLDGWTVEIGGKLDKSDVLSQVSPVCLQKDTGMVSFRFARPANATHVNFGCKLTVQLFRGTTFVLEDPYWNPIRCLRLTAIELAPLDTGWITVELPYDIRDWAPVDTCGDEPYGVFVRPVLYVKNELSTDQGGASTRSSVQLDNFCMDGRMVSVHNPLAGTGFKIYPNPNAGIFSVELPETARPDMSFRIVSLAGQLLGNQVIQAGTTTQAIQVSDLPGGLYFLQVLEDGKVVAIEKFVKQ